MYKYSSKTNSFYPVSLIESYVDLPDDLVEVSEVIFNEFSGQAPVGKMRGADKKGLPAWVYLPEPEPLTQAQIEHDSRAVRDDFLSKTDKMTLIDYSIRDVRLTDEQRNQLIGIRDEFKRWPQSAGFPDLNKLPNMPLWLFNESISAGWNAPKEYVPSELLEFYELLD